METPVRYQRQSPNILIRAIWYVLVGWWLSGVFIAAGYFCTATIVLAPLGFWFFNRVPEVHTLRLVNTEFTMVTDGNRQRMIERPVPQVPLLIRILWIPFGLVLGAGWLFVAWLLELPVITIPLSIWMIDRAPAIITLQRHA